MERRDCSQPLESGLPYPGDPPVGVEPLATVEADGFRVSELSMSTHAGTHVDAPAHFVADGRTVADYGVASYRFDAHLVDCTDCGPREAIGAERVPETDADLLVFHTGWSDRWGSREYFDHPSLTADAAERCVDLRCAVGVDAPSVDPTPAEAGETGRRGDEPEGHPAHETLLGAGRRIVENLTALAGLPERFVLAAYPLSVAAEAAPVRAVAVFDPDS